MKKHYETHVEDTDKLISVAGPVLDYKSWYEQYRKLMEEQAQRKYGLYTPTSEGDDDDFPSITGMIARYSALGLTNEQMAANPLWIDKTGNGHDLQLKNIAWSGMSGGQQCGRFAIWELVFLDHDATEEELTKIKDYFVKTYPWLFPDQAWTVVGKTNEDKDRATIANITGNGNDLVLSNFGFIEGSGYNEEGEHAGYLVTDGVDDKVQSSSFTMNEDWTIVGDWELLSNVQINCGIVKAQNVYLYNTANGLLISINNPRSLQSFGTKSLHAICSDGRLYDRNWVEYEYTVDQNFEIVKSSLNIGFNLNNYTQIAFKNLGIYNNQILSKDDCIKAYNYLQTLKSK